VSELDDDRDELTDGELVMDDELAEKRVAAFMARVDQNTVGKSEPELVPDNPLVLALFDEIVDNLDNCREAFQNIEALEASILRYGLLENLVGVEIPIDERPNAIAWIEVKAGSRRREAIRRLREKGHWPLDRPIPIVMRDSRGFWENLVENVVRLDVEPWEIGRRLSEASGSGTTHQEIGLRVGRTTGWVTRHIQIGRGVAPETIEFIKKNKLKLSLGELHRLSFLKDRYGDPDSEAQIDAIARRRRRRGPKKRDRDDIRAFSNRISYLREQMAVPPFIRPVVEAIIDYLEGGGRPNFRQLSDRLLGDKRRLLGGDDGSEETGEG
jgi:hypothetical protein